MIVFASSKHLVKRKPRVGGLLTLLSDRVEAPRSVRAQEWPVVTRAAHREIHSQDRYPQLYRRKTIQGSVLSGAPGEEMHQRNQMFLASGLGRAMDELPRIDRARLFDTQLVQTCFLQNLSCPHTLTRQTALVLQAPQRNAKMRWTSLSSMESLDPRDGSRMATQARQIKLNKRNRCSRRSVTRAVTLSLSNGIARTAATILV